MSKNLFEIPLSLYREGERMKDLIDQMTAYSATLDAESQEYWQYHRQRFEWTTGLLVELVAELKWHNQRCERLLDIGNSYQTMIFEDALPDIRVDTFGFFVPRYAPRRTTRHLEFDLNDAYYPDRWLDEGHEEYDIITFMEVVEHLYTAPPQVFRMLSRFLRPGGFMIVQTPNASALKKRLKLMKGQNPYELIREDRMNPGHFREYTRDELCHLAGLAGFHVKDVFMQCLFRDGARIDRFCDWLSNYLPITFRPGMTVVFRRAEASVS
jgi:SAM-dependent methyltransferase